MDDAYRSLCEAALRQNEALKRENQELRSRVEHLQRFIEDGGEYRPREDRVGTSLVLTMLFSMIFLTGAVIYAGAMAGLQAAQGGVHTRCPYASMSSELALAPEHTGAVRVELETAPGISARLVEADVRIDGRPLSYQAGTALSRLLLPGCHHQLTVMAPGYAPYESSICINAGTTNTLAVELRPAENLPCGH